MSRLRFASVDETISRYSRRSPMLNLCEKLSHLGARSHLLSLPGERLSQAIKRDHMPQPPPLKSKLRQYRIFSVLDRNRQRWYS
jgi:hypothetical protein